MERNRAAATALRQIAALLDEQGVAFKPAAYRRAAQVVEELPRDIGTYETAKELEALPGIGKAIADKLLTFAKTGRIPLLDELRAEQGGISAELMDIEDLGPKRVRQIQAVLGISTITELIAAAEAGKLRTLSRFSQELEQKILQKAKRVNEHMHRFPREEIESDVEQLIATIRNVPAVQRAEVAGSYRRKKETVGDIDIVVVTASAASVSQAIATLPMVRDVIAHGEKKLSFDLTSGLRVDVRFVAEEQWGSALLYFTGSKEHNIALRKKAMTKGWKLNEYGLFEGEKIIAQREEQDIYDALGVPYVQPAERLGSLPTN